MIILAVLLLVVVAAVVAFVLVGGLDAEPAELSVGALDVAASPLWFFVLGVVTLMAAELALALLRGGGRRKLARRRELKRLREAASRPDTAGPAAAPEAARAARPADTARDARPSDGHPAGAGEGTGPTGGATAANRAPDHDPQDRPGR